MYLAKINFRRRKKKLYLPVTINGRLPVKATDHLRWLPNNKIKKKHAYSKYTNSKL